ncbi:hypothetical protein ACFX14_008516 [Malus domestica]
MDNVQMVHTIREYAWNQLLHRVFGVRMPLASMGHSLPNSKLFWVLVACDFASCLAYGSGNPTYLRSIF